MSEPTTPQGHHGGGHKFHEVFQLRQGRYYDLPAAKISEMMKSNSLDSAPTQSLLSVVNGILDESIERKSGEIPQRVACLLRKVVQEIERRISTQAEHIRNQNNLIKAREEKYQSRIKLLETLANGANEEPRAQVAMSSSPFQGPKVAFCPEPSQRIEKLANVQLTQMDKIKNDESEKVDQEDMGRLAKEKVDKNKLMEDFERLAKAKEDSEKIILELRQDLETAKMTYERQVESFKSNKPKEDNIKLMEDIERLTKAKEDSEKKTLELKGDLEAAKRSYEKQIESFKTNMPKEDSSKLMEDIERLTKAKEDSEKKILELRGDLETSQRSYEKQIESFKSNKPKEDSFKLMEDIERLTKAKEDSEKKILELRADLEASKRSYEKQIESFKSNKAKEDSVKLMEDIERLTKAKEDSEKKILELRTDLEASKRSYEKQIESFKSNKAKEDSVKLMGDIERLTKAKEDSEKKILELQEDLEAAKSSYARQIESVKLNNANNVKEITDKLMEDVGRLTKAKEDGEKIILELQEDLETTKRSYERQIESVKSNSANTVKEITDKLMEDVGRLTKAKEDGDKIILELREDLETTKRLYEKQIESFKSKAMQSQLELQQKIKDAESLLAESRKRFKELEKASETKLKIWNQKENVYENFIHAQSGSLQDLRFSSDSIRQEVAHAQKKWGEEVAGFGKKLHVLADAAENYHVVLAENRKLYNEVQELKGNIRVYCRVRPFRPGENKKQSTVEHISDNTEIVLANPSKQGKDGLKMFKFNKVFGPTCTQEDVYLDTQPLVRSVLDGYNVCIFAYGQTGSGKTYTMTGPNSATEKEWGVNYRALNDLFNISQNRKGTIIYEVGVQMVEIYNEQVRDLLANNGANRKVGILTSSQPNGLAVPDATMLPVTATSDVLDLMHIGLSNRAVSATALNERSSRSHSIVTIHVRGTDLKGGSTFRGSLHLVDLAGSERVDRSEVTGDRLKEAQHINKSLSALGDVIFALSQKSSHVPYRNSKLTQLLQSSLGGHAKTLMFVQVNPDVNSYSETLSTLKFAERVSGVELGAAKSQKEGKDIRDLMEQVASLKDTIARKDEEIEQLQHLKDVGSTDINDERGLSSSLKHSTSFGAMAEMKQSNGSINSSKSASDLTSISEYYAEQSESGSQMSMDDYKTQNQLTLQRAADLDLGDADSEERLSDISDDGGLSVGTETDGSVCSAVELSLNSEQEKTPQATQDKKSKLSVQTSRQPLKTGLNATASRIKVAKDATKSPSLRKTSTSQVTPTSSKAASAAARRTWQ